MCSFLGFMLCIGLVIVCPVCSGVRFGQRETKCQVSDPAVKEASGLAISRVHHGVAYTHNDKGGLNEIFALNMTDCSTIATIFINSAINRDWEDLSYGPCLEDCNANPCRADLLPSRYCLYVADIGDHSGDGAANNIYVIREPGTLQNTTVDTVGLIQFNWTEPDAETLMISPDARLFVVSKVDKGQAKMAEIPSRAWNSTRVDLDIGQTASLKINTTNKDPQGGNISPDGQSLLLVAERHIFLYNVPDGDYIRAVNEQVPREVDTYQRAPHTGGVAWSEDGTRFYVIPEGLNAFLYMYTVDLADDVVVG